MNCAPKNVYRIPAIPDCLTTLRIKTTLISSGPTDLKVLKLVAPSGKSYVLRKATDVNGIITLTLRGETPDLPVKLLNPWAGTFLLFIDGFTYKNCEGKTYPGISFRIADTLDNVIEHDIDLTAECPEPDINDYSAADYSDEYNI